MTDYELGWLAGVLDSEGAVGLRRGNRGALEPAVQMETTCERTATTVERLCAELGVTARNYRLRNRNPDRHKASYGIRVTRLADVRQLAQALQPLAVTKAEQWRLLGEFVGLRLDGATFDTTGRVHRGGRPKPYTSREHAIYDQLRALNRRGPL